MRIFFSAGITGGRLIVLRPSSRGIASATNNPLPLSLTRDTDYKGRSVIERRYCHLQQWRGLATRYDKHAIVYRAAVILNAVIAWTRQLSDTP